MSYRNSDIVRYYQSSQWLYNLFCYNPQSLGMHFGFWKKGTKNRFQAQLNENQAILDRAGIDSFHRVLDAGCGVGGTAIYIAQHTGAEVYGISLDKNQIALAKQHAKKRGVTNLTHFSVQDYTKTKFPDNFFDVVYGIESICHASPKSTFLREAFRVLKPGGKLVVADGYLSREPKNDAEKKIVDEFCQSFVLSEFITKESMSESIRKAGFKEVEAESRLKEVLPSINQYFWMGVLAYPFAKMLSYFPSAYLKAALPNTIAVLNSKRGYDRGLVEYCVHGGVKPK